MSILPTIAILLIAASAVLQALYLFRKPVDGTRTLDPFSHYALALVSLILALVIAERSFRIGFPALTGTFESLVFYAAFICLVAFVYRLRSGQNKAGEGGSSGKKRIPFEPLVQFGATVVAFLLLALAASPLAPKDALAPIPALRSGWLLAHVALSFIGEAFFVAGFVASCLFLFSRDEQKKIGYDRITYTSVAVGYPIFTAGALVFGAIWAEQAWGAWWSWDPKETWALVTWLVYTFYLHLRFIARKSGSLPSWVSVLGFLCTIFTFFGVNYLLPGLHSYG